MKKRMLLLIPLVLIILGGCNGRANPAFEVFDNCQRWTAEEMDIFFDVHSKYWDYENSPSNMVGRIHMGSQDVPFCLGYDTAAQLIFCSLDRDYDDLAVGRFPKAPDDYTYIVKIDCSKIPDILPNGTILTFIREDITEDELYMPETLGEFEQDAA